MARQYKRDANGRFASSGTAVKTTTGRAGGFANQQHRSKVQLQRQSAAAHNTKGNAVTRAGKAALASPAFRRALVANGAKVTVPAVALAVIGVSRGGRAARLLGTRRGRDRLQLRQNQRQLSKLLSQQTFDKKLNGRRPIVARPGGGGSKSGRPTLRYASSTIRRPSARLRLSSARSALSGRL